VADAAEENVELDIAREGLATLESEGAEGRGLVEGGEGFGLSQGSPFKGRGGETA
jgi:hypothetical protein